MKRIGAAFVLLAPILAAWALAQTPPTGGPPASGPGRNAGNFAPPPFPGDTAAAERDSLMNVVMKSIAGKEQVPAESVFKDIQIFKGRPAGQIPRVMNYGFGRSLGVSCFHCHSKTDWAKDEKKQKRIAREMSKMAAAINSDYISKIEGLGGDTPPGPGGEPRRPVVNCSTCHRGSIRTGEGGGPPRPSGPR